MEYSKPELELSLPEPMLQQTTSMLRKPNKKIKIRLWSINRAMPWILFFFLGSVTLYTFSTMDYGNIALMNAVRQMLSDLKRIFIEPALSGRYSFISLIQALGVTFGLSILTTMLGAVIALLLSFLTARNLSNKYCSNLIRTIMSFTRAVPTILWVMIFAILIGLGPNAAIIGMCFHSIAYLTKVYSECIEEIDPGVIEALKAAGASWWQIIFQAILPTCFTIFLSWTFIRFEINFTNAIAVGAAAGAGGLGFQLAMSSNFYFDLHEIGVLVYMILAVVALLEIISIKLKSKYIVKT